MPPLGHSFLKTSFEIFGEFNAGYVFCIHGVFKKGEICFLFCPIKNGSIYLGSVSLTMIVFSDPESEIWFWSIKVTDAGSTDKYIGFLIEDKPLECLSSSAIFDSFSNKFSFLIDIWVMCTHIKMFVRLNECFCEIFKINSFDSKRLDSTPRCNNDRILEICFRILEIWMVHSIHR